MMQEGQTLHPQKTEGGAPRSPTNSFLGRTIRKLNDRGTGRFHVSGAAGIRTGEQPWSDIPVLPALRDYSDGLLIVTGDGSNQHGPPVRVELHFFADAEIQHRGVGAHLAENPEARHDFVIELDEFCLGKRVDINVAHMVGSCNHWTYCIGTGPCGKLEPFAKRTQRAALYSLAGFIL